MAEKKSYDHNISAGNPQDCFNPYRGAIAQVDRAVMQSSRFCDEVKPQTGRFFVAVRSLKGIKFIEYFFNSKVRN